MILEMEHMPVYNTLFLDRDGVINIQRPKDYVKTIDEFIFQPHAIEAIALLNKYFKYIIIITNQRGVGRGILKQDDLEQIHQYMLNTLRESDAIIDKIYYCTALAWDHPDRKTPTEMALPAESDVPEIKFPPRWFAGARCPMRPFADAAGIPAVLIGNKYKQDQLASVTFELHCPDLFTFANYIKDQSNR